VLAFVLLAVLGLSVPVTALFAVMFGAANGLLTIARGTVPLALFGAADYGRLLGRIAGPFLLIQAVAPLVLAIVSERHSDAATLCVAAAFALTAHQLPRNVESNPIPSRELNGLGESRHGARGLSKPMSQRRLWWNRIHLEDFVGSRRAIPASPYV
jgi:hypothetical protein